MPPFLTRAGAQAADAARRLWALARRYPVRAALVLPGLLLLYVLAVLPFTPSISDLRKAKSEFPSVVMSQDGIVLAEFRRLNRQWVPLSRISPHVVNGLIATEDHRFYQPPRHRRAAHRLGRPQHAARQTRRAAPRSRSSSRATCTRRRSAARSACTARSRRR